MKIEIHEMTEPLKLNWTIKEYIGPTVYKKNAPNVALYEQADLKEGDEIICGSWFFTVEKFEDGELFGQSEHLAAALEFNQDDRKCWVCGGIVNKRGIARANKNLIIGH
jgi:hypothetical protein